VVNDGCHHPLVLPAVVAHRGASAHRAEHTLGAYALALEQGADGLECDVRVTRDGQLVCVHDRTVDRTSTGRGAVSALTTRHLDELDYTSWHQGGPDATDQPSDELPARPGVLRLTALLELVADAPSGTRLFVETKHPVRYGGLVEAKLIALLARYGLAKPASKEESPIVVMSFSSSAVRRLHEYAPSLPTVLLFNRLSAGRRRWVLPKWVDYAGPGIDLLRTAPEFVARVAERGQQTYCWTVDEPEDVVLCQRLGVRCIATNMPAATRRVLRGTVGRAG
jgi:glycerophosphoryl diester phosphodiesterase